MKGLVLAGGGSRGSWEAGALKFMGESGLFLDGFSFVSGTSVGAINASGIAMFKASDFQRATVYVEGMWLEHITRTSSVWRLRLPLGIPGLWNPSVGVNNQLERLLAKVIDIDAIQESGVQVRYATVDVESGDLVIYSGTDLVEHGVRPVMASASYPMAFPPVDIGNRWLTDGGVRDTAPLGAAIKAGCDDIVVLTTRDTTEAGFKDRKDVGDVVSFGQRCLSIQFHETLQNDIKLCRTQNRWADLSEVLQRHEVSPAKITAILEELRPRKKVHLSVLHPLTPLGPSLSFSGEIMRAQIEQGYNDARKQLEDLLPS